MSACFYHPSLPNLNLSQRGEFTSFQHWKSFLFSFLFVRNLPTVKSFSVPWIFHLFFLWSSTSQPRGLGRGKGFHGKRVVGGITHRKYHPKCHPAITSWHAALPRRHIIAFCIKLKSQKMMWLWQVLDIRRVREISCSLTLRAPLQGRCSLFCLNEGSALSPVCFVNPPEKQTN